LAVKAKKFETAAKLRDQIRSLDMLKARQNMIMARKVDWDTVSLFLNNETACVNLFKIREGKLVGKENFIYQTNADIQMAHESTDTYRYLILKKFLEEYYLAASDAPKEIYLEQQLIDAKIINSLLISRFKKKIKIIVPQRGKARQLIVLGQTNAQEYLKNWLTDKAGHLDKINVGLSELKTLLKLPKNPKRIEAYDISNIQGSNAVGSMVVFIDGQPAKSQYRKFKIRVKDTPDDYAMLKEMLSRRMLRIKDKGLPVLRSFPAPRSFSEVGSEGGGIKAWPLPDLIVVDGGKGQLNAALAALRISNFKFLISKQIPNSKPQIPIIGLAKRLEEIYLPDKKNPIILPHNNPALQLLQRLRDEAHRFGITFHRKLRSKEAVKSALDDIPGIGPKTKKLLKANFGSVANIKKATLDELAKVIGKKLADAIKQNL